MNKTEDVPAKNLTDKVENKTVISNQTQPTEVSLTPKVVEIKEKSNNSSNRADPNSTMTKVEPTVEEELTEMIKADSRIVDIQSAAKADWQVKADAK